ncbi:hypothetical protein Tco_0669643, partial [Tanacetum coccineum]
HVEKSGVPNAVVANIKLVMPFNEGVLPVRYLGVLMVAKRLTTNDCKGLVEVIKKRIRDWINKVLSFAGDSIIGVACVAWKDICKPKCQGGLGLKSAYFWNKAYGVYGMYRRIGDRLQVGRICPLSRIITHSVLNDSNMCLKAKVKDMIKDNEWNWPIDWDDRFGEITNVMVLGLGRLLMSWFLNLYLI